MSDALSFADIDGQHVELLPARTVLSLFSLGDPGDSDSGTSNVVSTPSCQSALNQNPGIAGAAGVVNTTDFTCIGTTTSTH
jgi:hypothetical protein